MKEIKNVQQFKGVVTYIEWEMYLYNDEVIKYKNKNILNGIYPCIKNINGC